MMRALFPLFVAGLGSLAGCGKVDPEPPFVPDTDVTWEPGPPVARCAAEPPVVAPGEEALIDGDESFDPAGRGIEQYTWSFASTPPRATAQLESDGGTDATFTPDLAGEYVAQLVVSNSAGDSAPCTTPVQVAPTPTLWIELVWDNAGDDLDLHLQRPDAVYGSDDDCSQANCTPIGTTPRLSWGASGTADDPIVEADSTNVGPEVGRIEEPAGGTYHIAVQDRMNGDNGDTAARVSVFVNGDLAWTEERTFRGEPDDDSTLMYFAKVQFPSGTVSACSPGGC